MDIVQHGASQSDQTGDLHTLALLAFSATARMLVEFNDFSIF